jgi:hypothetical protein
VKSIFAPAGRTTWAWHANEMMEAKIKATMQVDEREFHEVSEAKL